MNKPEPIVPVKLKKDMTVNQLVKEFDRSGVMGAGRLADAVNIYERMVKDKDCRIFFGIAGAMIPGGMRNVLHEVLKEKWCDVFVCTGATLTHDMINALGHKHYKGHPLLDDKELNKMGFDRIYDSLMSNDIYKDLEANVKDVMKKLPKEEMGISGFLRAYGEHAPKDSILRIAYDNDITVMCPAIQDCGFGIMMHYAIKAGGGPSVNVFKDLDDIFNIAWEAKKKGSVIVGGGVPKNHIMQAFQFSPKPADYGIQMTMDRPEPGGSSGAPPREAISWGKFSYEAKFVNVISDATITFPLMIAALKERV